MSRDLRAGLSLRGLRHVHPDPTDVVAEHRALVDALAAGDERRARRCVERHLTRAAGGVESDDEDGTATDAGNGAG